MGFARGYLGILTNFCVLSAMLLALSSCDTNAARQARRDELVAENVRLGQEMRDAREALKDEQKKNKDLESRMAAFQRRLDSLDPTSPPQFSMADVSDNTITLDRLFSIKSGACFDRQGRSRCLYHEVSQGQGGGFIVYRTNRMFGDNVEVPIVDELGRTLGIVTIQVAEAILAWERANPFGATRLSTQP